jgi:GTPase Era involved in 16S rRNA processing
MNKEFELRYNPFEGKTELSYKKTSDTEESVSLSCFGNGNESRMPEWIYQFFPHLEDKYNLGDSECLVKFRGTPGNFEDLEDALKIFREKNHDTKISIEHINKEAKTLDKRLGDLKSLFDRMQKESPYPELKDEERGKKGDPLLRPDFERVVSAEFEISVIATMSSGKSTLINALLGQELMPARNEATTRKIARIKDKKDNNGHTVFTVRGLKKKDQGYTETSPMESASLEVMERLNSAGNVDLIELEGNIPKINSREMRLVLSDTPGPNNSSNADHAKHIDDLINADYKPMIMYILNATQLETNDDYGLLNRISKAMEGSGKQGKDRFLFVLNQADEFDPEKNELVKKTLAKCEEYLGKFKINGARIFPLSAKLSKLIRINQSGRLEEITQKERGYLNSNKLNFMELKALHFSDYSSLSNSCKEIQKMELQDAVKSGDENAQVLVYSGIRSVEIAVNEYLEKYALSAKISQAVNVFKKIVDDLHLAEKTKEELVRNNEKREKTIQQFDSAVAAIEKGEMAQEMVAKFRVDIESRFKKLSDSFDKLKKGVYEFFIQYMKTFDKNEADINEAKQIVQETLKEIEFRYSILSADLERLLNKELFTQAKSYLEQYKKYVEGLMVTKQGYVLDSALSLVQLSVPHNTNDLLGKFKKTKHSTSLEEKDGIFAGIARFFGGIFNQDWGYESVSHSEDVINMKKLLDENILPIQDGFINAIESGKKNAKTNSSGFLKYFEKEISELNTEIKKRASEQKNLLSEKDKLEVSIKENENKKAWLEQFIKELEAVLEI